MGSIGLINQPTGRCPLICNRRAAQPFSGGKQITDQHPPHGKATDRNGPGPNRLDTCATWMLRGPAPSEVKSAWG